MEAGRNPRRRPTMTFEPTPHPIDILTVEENVAGIRLTEEVLTDSKVQNNLIVANDGQEALMCLRRQGRFKNSPRPDLILLDLNLPIKDGREVLADIKADPDLKRIPVVLVPTSKAKESSVKTYNLERDDYVRQPADL